jgi:signal-transduction protein with cAMP-binding, CBS, and nucleotidyltransferase domain
MLLSDILRQKSHDVRTILPSASCGDVVRELVEFNIGSLLVCESPAGPLLGIVTERDILRAHVRYSVPLEELRVSEVMTRELISARPDDPITLAMQLMTQHRVRHLPVIADGTLHGIVSIGDIVKAHHDQVVMENHHMRSYIQGERDFAI